MEPGRARQTPLLHFAELPQTLLSPVAWTLGSFVGPVVSGRKIGSHPEVGVTQRQTSLGSLFGFGNKEPLRDLLPQLWNTAHGG